MSSLGFALRPFRHFADFHGRSTRTELAAFYFASMLIALVAVIVCWLVGLPDRGGRLLVNVVLLCPTAALVVRRLHDSGRSGWWALLGLPGAAISLRWEFLLWLLWQNRFDLSRFDLSAYVELPAGLLLLALFALLLADDQDGPNAWGINPRHPDDVGPSELPGEPA